MVVSAETFTLLLRDLIGGTAKVAVITGDDGVIEGLSIATYFAGCLQRDFMGGIYVIESKRNALRRDIEIILSKHARPGKILLIISDRYFRDGYSVAPRRMLANYPDVRIIFISKNPTGVIGSDFQINLNELEPKPHGIQLDHEESERQHSWN